MDCGPAALSSLLDGFHIPASYGRLREACQTDIDGTAIETIENVAKQAGLAAEQVMLPLDHMLLPEANALPAVAVVRSPTGSAHFTVAWRQHGPLVQVMDPSRGRLWLTRQTFLDQLLIHAMRVPADAWRAWAGSDAFLKPLRARLHALGVSKSEQNHRIGEALRDRTWRGLAALDAGTRMLGALRAARAVTSGDIPGALAGLVAACQQGSELAIAEQYWSVRPAASDAGGAEMLLLRGAVLVRAPHVAEQPHQARSTSMSSELAAAFDESPIRPLRDLLALVHGGRALPLIAAVATLLAVVGVVFEATLLRSAMDVGLLLRGPGQTLWAGLALTVFAAAMLALEIVLAFSERQLGQRVEGHLHIAFLNKMPRLSDAYFQSRPIADMVERSHAIHMVRTLPRLGVRFVRVALELGVTTLALVWISPAAAGWTVLAALFAAAIPSIGHMVIAERDLRLRTHAGALTRFHLDALRGRTAIEAQGAERTIEREHEGLLADWARAAVALQRASMSIEALQMIVGFGLAAWMVLGHVSAGASGLMLLQVYWMLNLPTLGYELALIAREYPSHRSTIVRLLEPLAAPEAFDAAPRVDGGVAPLAGREGVSIELRNASVRIGGHDILRDASASIRPGTHVAIIGTSGAGKSTLLGLLLGWSRTASGLLSIDDEELTPPQLEQLRQSTAWVDPTVRIWNRSLLENLLYGSRQNASAVGAVLERADLLSVVARLPEGLGTRLGEGGALLSAGEAQRVRLARAMLVSHPRLALLDEPFVGLERDRRRTLLAAARQHWHRSTMLYVTHDIAETRAFDRVMIMDRGRIVEDGDPHQLAQQSTSRYRQLLQRQESAQRLLESDAHWQKIRLEQGRIAGAHGRTHEHRS